MFVVSVKSSKLKAVVALIASVTFLALGILYITGKRDQAKQQMDRAIDLQAETAQERIAFLSQFGWQVEEEPVEIKEIQIPESFDEVYERYNALQREQGFDLTAYCGQKVKQWSYRVLNYPGNGDDREQIHANLLVCDGMVIGGDVSSVALDGFMQPFNALEKMSSGVNEEVTQTVNH